MLQMWRIGVRVSEALAGPAVASQTPVPIVVLWVEIYVVS
jgi:hypothetical protein